MDAFWFGETEPRKNSGPIIAIVLHATKHISIRISIFCINFVLATLLHRYTRVFIARVNKRKPHGDIVESECVGNVPRGLRIFGRLAA